MGTQKPDYDYTLTESEIERIYSPIGNESAYPELPGVVAEIVTEHRKAWESAVMRQIIATVPVCRETPDFIGAMANAMIHARTAPMPIDADDGTLAMIREAHAAQSYEFETDLTYCPSSDVPSDQCHTCIALARLDRVAVVPRRPTVQPPRRVRLVAARLQVRLLAGRPAGRPGRRVRRGGRPWLARRG